MPSAYHQTVKSMRFKVGYVRSAIACLTSRPMCSRPVITSGGFMFTCT